MPRTIQEIAKLAGVSTGTVSRVLNNRPRVNAETRERVQKVIEQFDYRPSAVARGLQGRKTGALMVVVPSLQDTYFVRAINRFNDDCRKAGFRLVLGCSNWSAEAEADYLNQALDGLVDGLIIFPLPATPQNTGLYAKLAQRHFPVVTIEMPCPGDLLSNILYDDAADFSRATKKLFGQGFDDVALLACDMHLVTVRKRHEGWLEAYRKAGKVAGPELSLASETGFDAFDFAPLLALARRDVAKGRRLAVLAQNDMLALRAILALEAAGLRAQQDVTVVGHGATLPPEFQKYPMASVEIPWREMCDRAMARLISQIEAKRAGTPLAEPLREVLGSTNA